MPAPMGSADPGRAYLERAGWARRRRLILALLPLPPHPPILHTWLRLSSSVVVSLASRPPTRSSSAVPTCSCSTSNREYLLFCDVELVGRNCEGGVGEAVWIATHIGCYDPAGVRAMRDERRAERGVPRADGRSPVVSPQSDIALTHMSTSFMGGNSTKATSGINGAGTQSQQDLGIPDSAKLFFEDTKRSVSIILVIAHLVVSNARPPLGS